MPRPTDSAATPAVGYRKRFYKVGEVGTLTDLEGHVLRYWETEFPSLNPRKSRGGQRLYTPADIELILHIKDLVHVQGYTIAGARRKLGTEAARAGAADADPVDTVRTEIRAILTMLEANDKL